MSCIHIVIDSIIHNTFDELVSVVLPADGFNVAMRNPCVVFAGHPSLHFGDVVHFMELWRHNSNNAVIFTGTLLLRHCYIIKS